MTKGQWQNKETIGKIVKEKTKAPQKTYGKRKLK